MRNQCVPSVFPTDSGPPGPEMRSPATAATGQGSAVGSFEKMQRNFYTKQGRRAIRWTVTADLIVTSFAIVDRMMP